jgi:hypothetical protein
MRKKRRQQECAHEYCAQPSNNGNYSSRAQRCIHSVIITTSGAGHLVCDPQYIMTHTQKSIVEHIRLEFTACALISLQLISNCSSITNILNTRANIHKDSGQSHHQAWPQIQHTPSSFLVNTTPLDPCNPYFVTM